MTGQVLTPRQPYACADTERVPAASPDKLHNLVLRFRDRRTREQRT